MSYNQAVEELIDDLSIFDDWTERYEYIISLGKKLPAMPDEYRRDDMLIQGCQSRVWVGFEELTQEDGTKNLRIHADSDSLITKGLIAIFIRLLSELPAQEIAEADLSKLDACSLREHLASTRANALNTMAQTIKKAAIQAL